MQKEGLSKPVHLYLISVALLIFFWMRLVFWGGLSLGFFIALLLSVFCLFVWSDWFNGIKKQHLPAPELSGCRQKKHMVYFLTVVISLLGASFFIFAQTIVSLVNLLILIPLLLALFLLLFSASQTAWDQPGFILELFLSAMLRPFIGLPELAGLSRQRKQRIAHTEKGKQNLAIIRAIGLGLLIAMPLIFVLSRILSAADAVFASYLIRLTDFLPDLSLNTLMTQLLITAMLTPFAFSFIMTGVKKVSLYVPAKPKEQSLEKAVVPENIQTFQQNEPIDYTIQQRALAADNQTVKPAVSHSKKITVVTILTMVDLLYLFFAVIQFRYLTGAFQAVLPDNMTYAEYARSGFFELLAVCALNILLLLGFSRRFDRKGRLGIWLRVLLHGLIAGSLVQWFSAVFRMRLYVDTFHLSQLRYFATALMLLFLVWFIFFLIAEWRSEIRITRWLVVSALCALVLVNYSNPDYQIADHNVKAYLKSEAEGRPRALDLNYLMTLSDEALPAISQLKNTKDEKLQEAVDHYLRQRDQVLTRQEEEQSWQSLNLVQIRARKAVEKVLRQP